MTDTFNDRERSALATLGFTKSTTGAKAHGIMSASMVCHGPWHFLLTATLPGGKRVSGFLPRSQIVKREEILDEGVELRNDGVV